MPIVNVAVAKAHLSRLIADVEMGGEVIIAKKGRPCARLVPMEEPKQRPLGFLKFEVPDAFFDPLPDAVLNLFEGAEAVESKTSPQPAKPSAERPSKRQLRARREK